MTISSTDLLKDIISQQIKVAHLDKKIDFAVVEADRVSDGISQKIGDGLKDQDILLGFVEKKTEENPVEDNADAEEKEKEEKKEDGEGKVEQVQESAKIQDLTSQMLSVPVKAKGCGCGCIGKKKRGKTAKPAAMPLDPIDREKGLGTPYAGGDSDAEGGDSADVGGGDAGGVAVAEAETEATGADLVEKLRKCVQKIFKSQETDSNKIEIKEVPEMTGVYYCLLKFGTPGIDAQKK